MTAVPEGMALVPFRGELIQLDDPAAVARAIHEVRRMEQALRQAREVLDEALIEESRKQGAKTLHFDGYQAKLSSGTEVVWDHSELLKLLDAGLPQERFDALVTATVEYKVNATVAKQLSSAFDVYAAIIDRAQTRHPKRVYVKVEEA